MVRMPIKLISVSRKELAASKGINSKNQTEVILGYQDVDESVFRPITELIIKMISKEDGILK